MCLTTCSAFLQCIKLLLVYLTGKLKVMSILKTRNTIGFLNGFLRRSLTLLKDKLFDY